MHVTVAAVGRDRQGPMRELFERYRERCPWPIDLIEVQARGPHSPRRQLEEEARRLLQAIPNGAVTVALDEGGRQLGSQAFADLIRQWQRDGRREVGFVIGGAAGLAPVVRSGAELVLGFGTMTWPHLLVRAMLAEQLYRASTILAGHPYHRD